MSNFHSRIPESHDQWHVFPELFHLYSDIFGKFSYSWILEAFLKFHNGTISRSGVRVDGLRIVGTDQGTHPRVVQRQKLAGSVVQSFVRP